jgi:hypothetical protein
MFLTSYVILIKNLISSYIIKLTGTQGNHQSKIKHSFGTSHYTFASITAISETRASGKMVPGAVVQSAQRSG